LLKAISQNRYDRECRWKGEKDKQQTCFSQSGERWVERAETKVFAKRTLEKTFITQPLQRALDIIACPKSCVRTLYIVKITHA
jgi:hypothetical protein